MSNPRVARVAFRADKSIALEDSGEADVSLDEAQSRLLGQIGSTLKAYIAAAQDLLNGKYAHVRDHAPQHLRHPVNVLALCCAQGLVVRYEPTSERGSVKTGWSDASIFELSRCLSEGVVHCHTSRDYTSTIPETGILLSLYAQSPDSQVRRTLTSARIGFDVVLEEQQHWPRAPSKPFTLCSVQNSVDIGIHGELLANQQDDTGPGQPFLLRTFVKLPVGWECVELFPSLAGDEWQPDFAPAWAETDLLAAVVASQFTESQYQSLDPRASARKAAAGLLADFKALLDSEPEREEALQSFLRDHPVLLCPGHTRMWPKLRLGAHVTDFVFRELAQEYVLVELERPNLPLFNKNGDESGSLRHARGQITDWKRYIEDNLSTVQREAGLEGISVNPKSLIVIGRSRMLSDEHRRRLVTAENETPKSRVVTYDDLYEHAKAVFENTLGSIWMLGGRTEVYYPPVMAC